MNQTGAGIGRRRRHKTPPPVMPQMCKSCPFRDDGGALSLCPEVRARIHSYLLDGQNHLCHSPQLAGGKPTHICRGGRDWQLEMWFRMRIIDTPTDEALEAAMSAAGVKCAPLGAGGKQP